MNHHFSADNHTHTYVIAPVNSFGSANLTCAAGYTYYCYWDGPGAFYGYFLGIAFILKYIMAASCILFQELFLKVSWLIQEKYNKIRDFKIILGSISIYKKKVGRVHLQKH